MEEILEDINSHSNSKHESFPATIKYVRRGDRTPEKDFHLKKTAEKKVICYQRSMMEKVRDKISKLEDAVEEREKEVESERSLRLQAETSLKSHLHDMYGRSEVNQELRDRLPRSNKSDPFKNEEMTDTDLSSIEEQIVADDEEDTSASRPMVKPTDKNSVDSQVIKGHIDKKAAMSSSPKSPKSPRRKLKFTEDVRPKTSPQSETEAQPVVNMEERFPRYPYTNISPTHGFYGHTFGANPYMPMNPGLLPGSFPNPMMHSTSLFPQQSSLYRPMSSPTLNSTFLNSSSVQEPNLTHSYSLPTQMGASNINSPESNLNVNSSADAIPKTTTTTGAMGGQSSHYSSMDSGFGTNLNLTGSRNVLASQRSPFTASLLPDHFRPSLSPRGTVTASFQSEQSKQLTSLLSEIDAQRAQSKKMSDELGEKDREIETLKLTLRAQGVQFKTDGSEAMKAAGLVEDVYTAQRRRDEATNGRMTLANQERDDVMERLQQLEARLDAQQNGSVVLDQYDEDLHLDVEQLDNEDVYQLMSKLDSPSSGEHEVSSLVKKVEMMRHRQREVINEEMQIVMEQRDIALARCRKLESELLHYQRQSEADGGMDKNLKAKLAAVCQERDMAVAQSKQLDNEIQEIRVYYSLHKSLSRENTVQQQANDTITACQEELTAVKHTLEHVHKENNHLVSQLRTSTIDKTQLQAALDTCNKDKERLKRLTNVLKRKLNSLNNQSEEDQQ